MPRRKLYTEHKFVTATLEDFARKVAIADFRDNEQIGNVKTGFENVKGLMHGHAAHENERIHALLRKKGSHIQDGIEADHAGHDATFQTLDELLVQALTQTDNDIKLDLGHQFYLTFQKFQADNLMHQFYEETKILPELLKLYADEEILAEVDGHTYGLSEMDTDALAGMMQALFPYFNKDDKYGMLNDVRLSVPAKFPETFNKVLPCLSAEEVAEFTAIFQSSVTTAPSVGTLSSGPTLFSSSASEGSESSESVAGEKRRFDATV